MRTFENHINAMEGIDVKINTKEASKSTGLPMGIHPLDGAGAPWVARNRGGVGFERAAHQEFQNCALQKKIASPSIVTSNPEWLEGFNDNIRTDFNLEQIPRSACLGTRWKPQNLVRTSFPRELFEQTREFDPVFNTCISILDADFEILHDDVQNFHAGT